MGKFSTIKRVHHLETGSIGDGQLQFGLNDAFCLRDCTKHQENMVKNDVCCFQTASSLKEF